MEMMAAHLPTSRVAMDVLAKDVSAPLTISAVSSPGMRPASKSVRIAVAVGALAMEAMTEETLVQRMAVPRPMGLDVADVPVRHVFVDRTLSAVATPGTTFASTYA